MLVGAFTFSVIKDREAIDVGAGEMSCFAFVQRFTRINSVEEACARIKQLGYVACRRVRIYGEEFELLSDPFPQADQIAIRAKAKGDSRVRILRLPVTIVQGGRGQHPHKHSMPPRRPRTCHLRIDNRHSGQSKSKRNTYKGGSI
jgi:hypothetical protein